MNTSLLPTNATTTMSSLTISELVESRHDVVKQSIERLAKSGTISLPPMAEVKIQRERRMESVSVYLVGKRDSYVVVAQLSPEFTARLVDRWQELESKQSFQIPQTMGEALRLAADLSEKVTEQAAALTLAAPKVEFYDTVTESDSVCQMAIAAQVAKLPFGRNTLFQKLREVGAFITGGERHNMPYQELVNRGLFTVNQRTIENPKTGAPIVIHTSYATQKGIAWIIKQFGGGNTEVAS